MCVKEAFPWGVSPSLIPIMQARHSEKAKGVRREAFGDLSEEKRDGV